MPTTDQPCAACHCDSARVENRGPLITTIVPSGTTLPAAITVARPAGQYGSAAAVWTAGASSYTVCSRPQVRSTYWSGTTNVPGVSSGFSEPTAHGPRT